MATTHPTTDFDPRFSSEGASAVSWDVAAETLDTAEVFWLSTLRADGRPHVVPLIAVWLGGALHFSTGFNEQKMRNLEADPRCALTTGGNRLNEESLDIVVEGEAARVTDRATLQRIADRYAEKYGDDWRYEVAGDGFRFGAGNVREDSLPDAEKDTPNVMVFAVKPATVFGFARGNGFGQTRWSF